MRGALTASAFSSSSSSDETSSIGRAGDTTESQRELSPRSQRKELTTALLAGGLGRDLGRLAIDDNLEVVRLVVDLVVAAAVDDGLGLELRLWLLGRANGLLEELVPGELAALLDLAVVEIAVAARLVLAALDALPVVVLGVALGEHVRVGDRASLNVDLVVVLAEAVVLLVVVHELGRAHNLVQRLRDALDELDLVPERVRAARERVGPAGRGWDRVRLASNLLRLDLLRAERLDRAREGLPVGVARADVVLGRGNEVRDLAADPVLWSRS